MIIILWLCCKKCLYLIDIHSTVHRRNSMMSRICFRIYEVGVGFNLDETRLAVNRSLLK